jgi:two-component system sensor histidine kinase BaeS
VPIVRGVVLAGVVVLPFLALFAAADATFAEWIDDIGARLPDLDEEVPQRLLIAGAVLAAAGALVRSALGSPPSEEEAVTRQAVVGRTEWVLALGALNAVFVAFLIAQLAAMWGGEDYLMRTAGLTRAEYAREGFGQLVAAAALTLVVIAAARRWTVRSSAREERLQRLLLGSLCVFTLIILVSAWNRLDLYVDAFGQTRSRYFGQAEILWLAALFLLLLVASHRAWLPRAAASLTGAAVLLLALSNPDARIAEHNIERLRDGRDFDTYYHRYDLSEDAVPALLELPPRLAQCAVPEPSEDGSAAAFNLARSDARAAYRRAQLAERYEC